MNTQAEQVGVMGGSFNPVHVAHLVLAERAREALRLDRVLLVPSGIPPHKDAASVAAAQHRLAMLRLAAQGNPALEVSDIETRRPGISYTVDTVLALRQSFPAARLYFLIGLDTVPELRTWRRIETLVQLCDFVPFCRPGVAEPDITALAGAIGGCEAAAILARRIEMPLLQISSTEIRHRIAEGRSVRYLVPDAVRDYIAEHRLYTIPEAPRAAARH